MPHARLLVLCLVLAAACGDRENSLDETTATAIDAAIAQHLKPSLGSGGIVLEPRVKRDDGWADVRDPARVDALAKALGAMQGQSDTIYVCTGLSPSGCYFRGSARTIVSFSEPLVNDDSAVVHMERLDYHGGGGVPVSVLDTDLYLTRTNDHWRVVSEKKIRSS
jgi:hypothetical protein